MLGCLCVRSASHICSNSHSCTAKKNRRSRLVLVVPRFPHALNVSMSANIDGDFQYVALQLAPQKPRFRSAAGQLDVQQPARAGSPKPASKLNKTLVQDKPDFGSSKKQLQAKCEQLDSKHGVEDTHNTSQDAKGQQCRTGQQQRQSFLQHLGRFKLRAAAIKSTAEAVHEWYEQQTSKVAGPLPADALHILNQEADKGLLHMLSVGLIPWQLELSAGLCGSVDAPFHARAADIHAVQPKQPMPADIRQTCRQQHAAARTRNAADKDPAKQPVDTASPAVVVSTAQPAAAPVHPRAYEVLLDDLSEHQLLIFKGKLVQETPQMLSFLRIAAPSWSSVSVLLSQLEAVCKLFKVPLAVIDGKALLRLSAETTGAVTADASAAPASKVGLPDLLCCIANLDEIEHLFEQSGEAMPSLATQDAVAALPQQAETPAAVTVECQPDRTSTGQLATTGSIVDDAVVDQQQAVVDVTPADGTTAVNDAADWGPACKADATVLHRLQHPLLEEMYEARRKRDMAFQQLQQSLRQQWQQLQQHPHVVLHLPSMPPTQEAQQEQQATQGMGLQPCEQQPHQLWRLLDVLRRPLQRCATDDADVDHSSCPVERCVALVVSQAVAKTAQEHWLQMLADAGVTEPGRNIRFVVAERSPTMPAALPLSAQLLASQKALDRCRQIVLTHSSTHASSATPVAQQPQQAFEAGNKTAGTTTHEPAVAPECQAQGSKQKPPWNYSTRCPSAGFASKQDTEAAEEAGQTQSAALQGLPPGYIVPGCPTEHDLDVAVKLGLPLLGATPQLAQVLASRIGSRSLFAAAGIRVPPGGILPRAASTISDITGTESWQPLLTAMCLQLLRWPQQHSWMLKLNNLSGTIGLAVLDLRSMQQTQAALQQLELMQLQQEQQQQSLNQFSPIDVSTVPQDVLQQHLQHMTPVLLNELPLGLNLAQQQHWQKQAVRELHSLEGCTADNAAMMATAAYVATLRQQGGIMEALLDDIVCCPLVQLLIEPTGDVQVLATQDKILHGCFSSPGSTFPSSCPAPTALVQAATAAGKAAYTAGMLGYMQVSFLCTSITPSQAPPKLAPQVPESVLLWGCDLVPWASPDLAIFRLFDAEKAGRFAANTGKYLVPRTVQEEEQPWQGELEKARQKDGADGWWRQQHSCTYASLHQPAAVLSARQLSTLADKCTVASRGSEHDGGLHFGIDSGVLVSFDDCSRNILACLDKQHSKEAERTCATGVAMSGLVCFSSRDAASALSHLSSLIGSL